MYSRQMKSGPTAGNNANPHHVGGSKPPLGLHEGFGAFFRKQGFSSSRGIVYNGGVVRNEIRVAG